MWVTQELKAGLVSVHLFEDHIAIEEHKGPGESVTAVGYPCTRDEANRLSIAFRQAAIRLEAIGKGLE